MWASRMVQWMEVDHGEVRNVGYGEDIATCLRKHAVELFPWKPNWENAVDTAQPSEACA